MPGAGPYRWCLVGALALSPASNAWAQAAPPGGRDAPKDDTQAPTATVENESEIDALKREMQAQRVELERQKEELAAQRKALDERLSTAEAGEVESDDTAFLASLEHEEAFGPQAYETPLDIYGFFDIGFQKLFIQEESFFRPVVPTNASSFVLGNLNLFFDAKPHEDWRGLAEIRFTNIPHGNEIQFGSPVTEYERIDNTFDDQTNPNGRNELVVGSIIIERLWAQWSASDALQLRVGSWFTPYGIWNIDHGTPTLISLLLPNSQNLQYFPLRQLGVQALGTFHAPPWEVGYHAYISNGRTFTQFDFTEDKALGGRLFAARAGGSTRLKFGASGYWGTFTDVEKNITSFAPFAVETTEVLAASEWGLGADVSLDAGPFRLRSEAVLQRVDYEDGKRPPANTNPTAFEPDQYRWNAYVLGAYRLPWGGLEPYLWLEYIHGPSAIGATSLLPSAGLNVYLTPQVQLKAQYGHAMFIDSVGDLPGDASMNNFGIFTSRLVVAF